MKNFAKILVVLCLALALLTAMVACGGDKNYEDHEETLDLGTIDTGVVTAPTEETEPNPDDAYINAAPANDEQGWGELTPAPGK